MKAHFKYIKMSTLGFCLLETSEVSFFLNNKAFIDAFVSRNEYSGRETLTCGFYLLCS